MKKKLAFFFLALATVLGLILVVIDFYDEKTPQIKTSEKSCKIKDQQQLLSSQEDIMQWTDKHIVSWSSLDKKIRLYSWAYDNDKLSVTNLNEHSLLCSNPGYHCFPKEVEKKAVDFKMIDFHAPYGLVQLSNINPDLTFPWAWDSKEQSTLGAPLNICSKNLDSQTMKFYWIDETLIVYDHSRSTLGTYSLSEMNGASIKSAPKEADKIYFVSQEGDLIPSNCSDPQMTIKSGNLIQNKNLFIFQSQHQMGQVYIWDKTFKKIFHEPLKLEQVSIPIDKKSSLNILNPQGIFEISVLNDQLQKRLIAPPVQNYMKENIFSYWNDGHRSIEFVFPKWLMKTHLLIGNKNESSDDLQSQNLPPQSLALQRKLYRSMLPFFRLIPYSPQEFHIVTQDSQSEAEFSSIVCE